jgi:hypothetical protein
MKINKIFDLIEKNSSKNNDKPASSSNKLKQFPVNKHLKSVLNEIITRESTYTKINNRIPFMDKENIANNQRVKKRKRPLKINQIFNLLQNTTEENNFQIKNNSESTNIDSKITETIKTNFKLEPFISNVSTRYSNSSS